MMAFNLQVRAALIYAVLLIAATAKIASMPDYSFDSFQYSYLASPDAQTFKSTPGLPSPYLEMSDDTYLKQKPFYTTKLLFIGLVRLSAKVAGVLRAPMLVSLVAYFLLGSIVWLWLGSCNVGEPWRTVSGLLLMFSSVTTGSARMGTPDLLCTLLLVSGAWLLFESRYPVLGALPLLLSVLTRLDCAILAGTLFVLASWAKKFRFRTLIAFLIAVVAIYIPISRVGYSYPILLSWTIRTSYWRALLHNFVTTELAIYCPFLLLAVIAWHRNYRRPIILACAISLALRYAMMPHLEMRYLLPQALIAGILGVASVLGKETEVTSPAVFAKAA
jgi:hypothetical protein